MRLWALFRSVSVATSVALAASACDSGEEVTPASTFADEVPESRNIGGRVLAGTEPVPGALVRVDVSPGFATDAELEARAGNQLPRTDTANGAGSYRFAFGPLSHDLSVRAGREMLVVRALGVRTFDVPLGVEAVPSGFAANVVPTTNPPTKAGNAVAYFVSGQDARTLAGDSGTRVVKFRRFESTVTLHAFEYVARLGPSAAVAHGQLDVLVRDGVTVTPIVPMELLPATAKPVFEATPPSGYALEPLDVEMDFGLEDERHSDRARRRRGAARDGSRHRRAIRGARTRAHAGRRGLGLGSSAVQSVRCEDHVDSSPAHLGRGADRRRRDRHGQGEQHARADDARCGRRARREAR